MVQMDMYHAARTHRHGAEILRVGEDLPVFHVRPLITVYSQDIVGVDSDLCNKIPDCTPVGNGTLAGYEGISERAHRVHGRRFEAYALRSSIRLVSLCR
jgi:hypothetical protein